MGQVPAEQKKKPDRMFPDAAEAAPDRMSPERRKIPTEPGPGAPPKSLENPYGRANVAPAGQSSLSQFVNRTGGVPTSRGAFGPDTDPTNRESLMENLANRPPASTMEAGQAAGTTVAAPSQVDPTLQVQAGQIAGPGTTALGGMAQGQISAGMQAQNDQMLRAIQAQQAGVRGSQNVGLGARVAGEQMGRAGAQLAGIAAERQMQAAGMESQLAAQQAQMEQGASTEQARLEQERAIQNARMEQETNSLQAQLQQSLNLSNAEMQQRANEINLQVETQLGIERDRRINELMQMGVDEEIARMRAEEEAWKFKSELTFNYWNAAVQDELARDVARSEETWTAGGAREQLAGGAVTAGGAGTPVDTEEEETKVSLRGGGGTAADIGEAMDSPSGVDYLNQKPWDRPPGEMFDPTMGGQPRTYADIDAEESMMGMSSSADISETDVASAEKRVNETLNALGDIQDYGGTALAAMRGPDEAKGAVLDLAKKKGTEYLTEKLGDTAMGGVAGPAVQGAKIATSALQSDSPAQTAGQGLAGLAGSTGGSYLGGLAGGAIGSIAGPAGATLGAGFGKAAGAMLGGLGASEAYQGLQGGPAGAPSYLPPRQGYVDVGESEEIDISPETEIEQLRKRIYRKKRGQ